MAEAKVNEEMLGKRFEEAMLLALRAHARQVRKATSVPYAAHLLTVCALVLEEGGDEDEAIAALLHDALEDQPQSVSRELVRERFGEKVLELVELSTDTPPDHKGGTKPSWDLRKQAYLERLAREPWPECRVAVADKLHNLRAMARDYRLVGEQLWDRFSQGREKQLWYHRKLVDVFRGNGIPAHVLEEMETHLAALSGAAA
jgi:(p)ppGpp synthase/HD superfamily hydrolase